MARPAKKPFWRITRRVFRWCRITVWLLILVLLASALWLNRVGLPDFAKDVLVTELRLRGFELNFTRMRLAWYRGIVADNIQFGRPGETNGLRISATEAEVHLHLRSLLRRQIDIEGVVLRDGRVVIPVWGTNDQPHEMTVQNVSGEVRFLPNDQWELVGFRAETFGVNLRLQGAITNATAIRKWKLARKKPEARTPQAFWHDLVAQFEETRFEAPAEIVGSVSGDARHLETFRAKITISSPGIDSPWGHGRKVNLAAEILPQAGSLIYAEVKLEAEDAMTRWGNAGHIALEAQIAPSLTQWTPTNAHLNLQVQRAQTPWGRAAVLGIKADFRPNPSDVTSALAEYSIRAQQLQTTKARFARAEFNASGVVSASNAWPRVATTKFSFGGGEVAQARAAAGSVEASLNLSAWDVIDLGNTNLSWWTRAQKISGDVTARLDGVRTPELELKTLALGANWTFPQLNVRDLGAALYGGELRGSAQLDTDTRLLMAELTSTFDLQKLSPLLNTNAQRWLTQIAWEQAPRITATARVHLPPWDHSRAWTNIEWRGDVLPTLSLNGSLATGPVTFQAITLSSTRSDFSYSNRTWRLPNLVVTRPDGQVRSQFTARDDTGEFEAVLDSTVDPRFIKPLLAPVAQRVVDDFTLTMPPSVQAEVSGRWSVPKELAARAQFAVTNAGYRGRAVQTCHTLITMTNMVLSMMSPVVVRPEGVGRAESVVIDIPRMKLFINNATGALEVAAVTHVISPGVEEIMAPYRFLEAPQASAHGFVDLEDGLRSDLRFTVAGGPFEWRSFRFQAVTGDVHWAGTLLTISNVTGSLHGGGAQFSGAFNFETPKGVDFGFRTLVHNVNFHSLMNDLLSPTNKLEGVLSGLLVITNANTEITNSWFGYGNADLQEGLLWDVPMLGLFSPILNALKPGAGNSRARQVSANFVITNSVVFSSDLQIHASGMRLNYDGIVDFDGRVNGRMEAELLRDMPGLGQLVSKVLWPVTKLFEYKVAGSLGKPKSQPVYIPKILMMPFHPLRTLKELMDNGGESDK